jgi:hypothetical protein
MNDELRKELQSLSERLQEISDELTNSAGISTANSRDDEDWNDTADGIFAGLVLGASHVVDAAKGFIDDCLAATKEQ